ncbi:hypothetical protein LXL04_020627 [Taraxacum kok-saghyz]
MKIQDFHKTNTYELTNLCVDTFRTHAISGKRIKQTGFGGVGGMGFQRLPPDFDTVDERLQREGESVGSDWTTPSPSSRSHPPSPPSDKNQNGGAKELLQSISEKQGRKMNSTESAKDIQPFLKFFKDQVNMAEVKYPLDHFKTFNEFFIRELKPGARPIAYVGRDDVAVCAADCRLMAFKTVEESLRFWIKGKKFSIRGLLGNLPISDTFNGGTLVIFRLAPQAAELEIEAYQMMIRSYQY